MKYVYWDVPEWVQSVRHSTPEEIKEMKKTLKKGCFIITGEIPK